MTIPDPWLVQFEERRKELEHADRSFEFLGETLVHKAMVAPEVGFRLGAFQRKQLAYSKEQTEKVDRGETPDPMGVTDEEFLELCEWTIRSCLEPESIEGWERLRSPDAREPLSLIEIYGFATYVQAKAAGVFPTVAPTSSSDGRSNGGSSSKGASPSRVKQPRRSRVT